MSDAPDREPYGPSTSSAPLSTTSRVVDDPLFLSDDDLRALVGSSDVRAYVVFAVAIAATVGGIFIAPNVAVIMAPALMTGAFVAYMRRDADVTARLTDHARLVASAARDEAQRRLVSRARADGHRLRAARWAAGMWVDTDNAALAEETRRVLVERVRSLSALR